MGILVVSLSVAILVTSIILYNKVDKRWQYLAASIAGVFLLALIVIGVITPNPVEYKYEAKVTMPCDTQGNHTTIYFNEFTQNETKVQIDNFVTCGHWRWVSFNPVVKSDRSVIISLSDNNGKFIYKDRVLNKTFDDNLVATQP